MVLASSAVTFPMVSSPVLHHFVLTEMITQPCYLFWGKCSGFNNLHYQLSIILQVETFYYSMSANSRVNKSMQSRRVESQPSTIIPGIPDNRIVVFTEGKDGYEIHLRGNVSKEDTDLIKSFLRTPKLKIFGEADYKLL